MFKIITNSYHQVMNISIWLGGNISSRYIDEIVARDTMEDLINGNPYLNSDSNSGSINAYQDVASWGIGQGKLKPIIWSD